MRRAIDEAKEVKAGAHAVLTEIAWIIGAGMQRLIHKNRLTETMSDPQTCDQRMPGIGVRKRTQTGEPHAR